MAAPTVASTSSDLRESNVDALVVGTVAGPDGLALAPRIVGATGETGEIVKLSAVAVLHAPLLLAAGQGAVSNLGETPEESPTARAAASTTPAAPSARAPSAGLPNDASRTS